MPVSHGFEIVPAAVSAAAGTFHAEAAALTTASVSLGKHLAAIGAGWGHDEVGARFGAEYAPAAELMTDNLEALAVGLFRIAAALRAVAAAHIDGETELLVLAKSGDAELADAQATVAAAARSATGLVAAVAP